MTVNDLECPIQLKVRMSHGLLADSVDTSFASLLCYSYTTVYCGLHERNTRVYPTVDSGITNFTHDRLCALKREEARPKDRVTRGDT